MTRTGAILLALLAPGAWALAMLIGTALPGWTCGVRWQPATWAVGLLLAAVMGAAPSWRRAGAAFTGPARFAATLAAALAAMLTLPLLLQFLATLLVDPCAA